MSRLFVVVSGLPGSGKTTLGRELARTLELPLIDKDEILERLFVEQGTGDAAWRRRLSRESDALLETRARGATPGAVIVSFWHLNGMAADSGTATGWLADLDGSKVHVHCRCPIDAAASRFQSRSRHPGHLDRDRPASALAADLEALARCPLLTFGRAIDIDTASAVDVAALAREILSHRGRN